MENMPKMKIGIVAVSRDCFPESLSVTRRENLVKAYAAKYDAEDIYECPICIVESEIHMVQALEDIKKAGCNALCVYLGNFGPEIAETLLAKHFDGPKMFVAAAEETSANGGLIHLGNVPLFICAILFGKKSGALAGGIGMGLFDLLSGWTAWAPFTFVIVAIMGYVVGAITEKHHGLGFDALAIVAACVIKVVGYYIAEGIIYGNWIAPFTSIPGNLVQIGVAAVVVLIVIEPLRKAANKIIFK